MLEHLYIERDLLDLGVVAILRNVPLEKLTPLAEALKRGGVNDLEVTLNSPNALEGIRQLSRIPGLNVGAGTVLDEENCSRAIDAGAKFIVCPHTDTRIITRARVRGAAPVPGCMTPTEMMTAMNAGAHILKVFPASTLGPGYIHEVLAPLNHAKLLAVGGITVENVGSFIEAGAKGVGVGSTLTPKDVIEKEDWQELERRARALCQAVQAHRK